MFSASGTRLFSIKIKTLIYHTHSCFHVEADDHSEPEARISHLSQQEEQACKYIYVNKVALLINPRLHITINDVQL